MRTQSLAFQSALIVGFFSLSSCGGGLSPSQSQAGFATASSALSSAQASAATQVTTSGSASSGSFTVNVTSDCPGGGSVALAGTATEPTGSSGASSYNLTFSYTATFNACVENGTTINGSLTYAFKVDGTDSSTAATVNGTYSYDGTLDFSGQVSGSCDMDLTGTIDASASAGASSASVTYSGTICGNDASTTLTGI
jgi:hypothetical protein